MSVSSRRLNAPLLAIHASGANVGFMANITVTRSARHVRAVLNGHTVADSKSALEVKEGSSPMVYYVPMADLDMAAFTKTKTTTHCPYKGDASYWSITVGDRIAKDAVWGYETPLPAVSAIAGHVAFYANRVDSLEIV